jgi:capsular polysaccharide transport system permease protein
MSSPSAPLIRPASDERRSGDVSLPARAAGGLALRDDGAPLRTAWAPRHRSRKGLLLGLLLFVLLPLGVTAGYLHVLAADQYVSEFRFTVRRQAVTRADQPSVMGALSGVNPLAALLQDSEIINQYLRSRQALDDLRGEVDVVAMWSRPEQDWLFRLDPSMPIEQRLRYWRGMVQAYLDNTTGVTTVRVWAFTPEDAARLAAALRDQAEALVNSLGRRSQEDWLRQAQRDVAEAEADLQRVRLQMAEFRNANEMLFPSLNAQMVSQVETRLRESLADLRSQLAVQIASGGNPNAVHVDNLRRRVASLEQEARRVRGELTGPAQEGEAQDRSIATRLSGYTALEVEERLAIQRVERAQTQLSVTQAEAARQLVYLTTFVAPALAETSEWPRRWLILLQVAAGGVVLWLLVGFALRSIREHAA